MLKTFGKMPAGLPDGFLCVIKFPVLCMLDTDTGDHRLLDSEGADVRDLPLTIKMQDKTSYGHEGATVSGALFEVTIDPETNEASGLGFLLDDEVGQKHAVYVRTGAMRGNSVDMAEVKARYEEEIDADGGWDYRIRFVKWAIAATTGVATPAFRQARAEITAAMTDEIIASLRSDPMEPLVCEFDEFSINVIDINPEPIEVPAELLASGIVQPYGLFFHPETAKPQKIVVTADNHVYGNLGLWDQPHDGIQGQRVTIPRPTDAYASFNKPGVLTDRGIVNTGPIFAYGGHRPGKGVDDLDSAYGGAENAWADVRITEGVHGPWISGVVRPGVADETVYAARASRISGHWLGGRLKAIVSVNAEGFDVPGQHDELYDDLAAGYAYGTRDGELELVASFPEHFGEDKPLPLHTWSNTLSVVDQPELTAWLNSYPSIKAVTFFAHTQPDGSQVLTASSNGVQVNVEAPDGLAGLSVEQRRNLIRLLHEDDEDEVGAEAS